MQEKAKTHEEQFSKEIRDNFVPLKPGEKATYQLLISSESSATRRQLTAGGKPGPYLKKAPNVFRIAPTVDIVDPGITDQINNRVLLKNVAGTSLEKDHLSGKEVVVDRLEDVFFRKGNLTVTDDQRALKFFLDNHPMNASNKLAPKNGKKWFKCLDDPKVVAKKRVNKDIQISLVISSISNLDETEASLFYKFVFSKPAPNDYTMVYGKLISKAKSSYEEVKAKMDKWKETQNKTKLLLEKAIDQKIVRLDSTKRIWYFNGEDKGVTASIPESEDPKEVLIDFMEKKGAASEKFVNKLKSKLK